MIVVQALFQIGPPLGKSEKQRQRRGTQQQPRRRRRGKQGATQQHANHESRGEQEHVQQRDVLGGDVVGKVGDNVGEHNRQDRRFSGGKAEAQAGQQQQYDLNHCRAPRHLARRYGAAALPRMMPVCFGITQVVERIDRRIDQAETGQTQQERNRLELRSRL